MNLIYQEIVAAKSNNQRLLAILLDPEKLKVGQIKKLSEKIMQSPATHIFIGGSTFNGNHLDALILELKKFLRLPILLFPGSHSQLSAFADGLLFLSLFSGRNAEYLIGQQVKAVPFLEKMDIEVIPTAYLLIDGGKQTAVELVSDTKPLQLEAIDDIWQTAKAATYIGSKLIYLEAGSGASMPVSAKIIEKVSEKVSIPVIVGGGIRNKKQMESAFQAGATLVVIGTAFENDSNFFKS